MSQETRGSGVLVCLLAALCKGSPLSAVLLTAHLPHRQLPPGGFSESKWPPVNAEGEDVCGGGVAKQHISHRTIQEERVLVLKTKENQKALLGGPNNTATSPPHLL